MPLRPQRHPFLSLRVWLAYGFLLAVGIPWYWPADSVRFVMGLPLWAVVSFASSAGMSALTVWLALRHWPEDADPAGSDPEDGP